MSGEGHGTFACGFAGQLESFVAWRKASGRWNELQSSQNLRRFDRHCATVDPGAGSLSQGALDSWCDRLPTESAASCKTRTSIARQFAVWALERGLTEAVPPDPPRVPPGEFVPHDLADDELGRFFAACDAIEPYGGRLQSRVRKAQCCCFFRLLYSTGMRTTEARLLRREDVDLSEGVVTVRRSKGPDEHYVALHPSMAQVMRDYDACCERLQPGREWEFQSSLTGGPVSRWWVIDNFKAIWGEANGEPEGVTAYAFRHHYATANIMSWDCDAFDAGDRLVWLSKSMGHRDTSSTLYYFSLVPAISDKIEERTGERMDEILPEPWEWGEVRTDGR